MDKEVKEMFELILDKLGNMETKIETIEMKQDEIFQVVKGYRV